MQKCSNGQRWTEMDRDGQSTLKFHVSCHVSCHVSRRYCVILPCQGLEVMCPWQDGRDGCVEILIIDDGIRDDPRSLRGDVVPQEVPQEVPPPPSYRKAPGVTPGLPGRML